MEPNIISTARWIVAMSLVQLTRADNATCGHSVWGTIQQNKDNSTALNTMPVMGWVPEPEVRGTFSILLTCVLTLVACIYSALHLNIPYDTGTWPMLRTKAFWVRMALFAPEIVLFTAMSQYKIARKLSKDLKSIQEGAALDSEARKFTFDMKYGFFVVMGGVQIPLARLDKFLSESDLYDDPTALSSLNDWRAKIIGARLHHRPTARLTPKAIVTLAQLGHWIDIPPQHIEDHSKADGIQKSLILVQVSWMLVSCVARKLYGLPLTLLEIHTMVHVVCAFLIYFFWFKKPLDIRDPEPKVFPDSWDDALAYFCQGTFYSRSLKFMKLTTATQEAELQSSGSSHACHIKRDNTHSIHLPCNERAPTIYHVEYGGHILDPIVYTPEISTITDRWHATIRTFVNLKVDLSDKVFSASFHGHDAFRIQYSQKNTLDDLGLVRDAFDEPGSSWRIAGIVVLPIIYGGIHLTAWSFAFPTWTEAILWRVSCFIIIAPFPVLGAMYCMYLLDLPKKVPKFFSFLAIVDRYTPVSLYTFGFFALFNLYGLCRVFLVVESFISLRFVPIGAYWVPEWLQYIPHV